MSRLQQPSAALNPIALSVLLACLSPFVNRESRCAEPSRPLPEATAEHLPRWRGFNLQEKFYLGAHAEPFREEDFRLISRLGFNFVRLPMDYRVWIRNGDWTRFNQPVLQEIDQAVEWGKQYGVHVMLNFHRAPGYTVARPPERNNLWTDAEAQRVCALHWAAFARRYRGVPNSQLSFNLFNEPPRITPETYLNVCRKMVAAIREQDPNRLIVADGIAWGTQPVPELAELKIAQATRGYQPMAVSHYQASWVSGERFPRPAWPRVVANGLLLAPSKKEPKGPLILKGPFQHNTRLRMHVMVVSRAAHLMVEADGRTVWEKRFVCGPGQGEWKKAVFREEYKIYQNVYDRDYTATIPAGARQVRIRLIEGDWLHVSEIGLTPERANAREDVLALDATWGQVPEPIQWTPESPASPFTGPTLQDRKWLWEKYVQPWAELKARGVGVMVGEFGAYNKTPHDVVLRWMEDCLANWRRAGFGWALWQFRGSFGVLDSERTDVTYEEFEGHQLDRRMLELLQRY